MALEPPIELRVAGRFGRSRVDADGRDREWAASWAALLTAAAASLFTGLVVFVHPFDVAYRSWTLHVAIQTVASLVCFVAAYLFGSRYLLGRLVTDLVLACSLLILAVGGLCFSLLPAALAGGGVTRFSTWAPVVTDLIGASGFAAAAFVRSRAHLRRSGLAAVALVLVAVVVGIAVVIGLEADRLPIAISPRLSPVGDGRRLFVGRHEILAMQLVSVLLFAASSVGFWRRRREDELIGLLATATCLGAFAALNYVLFPSLYSQWVYSGDILRMSFYLVLLVGVAHEVNRYWRDRAAVATLEERRRIARELHDGLAQELAFLVSRSKLLDGELARQLGSAAERALEESRRAIDVLTRPLDEPVGIAVRRAAEEVAIRFGMTLAADVEPVPLGSDGREALRRIAREAAINAATHGGARHLTVALAERDGSVVLRVADDGCGFDLAVPTSGFGLISMSERAAAVGGSCRVSSQPGAGTIVEVTLP